jgi:hypothetical protein
MACDDRYEAAAFCCHRSSYRTSGVLTSINFIDSADCFNARSRSSFGARTQT